MTIKQTAGSRFRDAVDNSAPLQIMGTINAYTARMATQVGYKAIYLLISAPEFDVLQTSIV